MKMTIQKNITQLFLYSNMYILDFLDAFIYILNSYYLSKVLMTLMNYLHFFKS